MQVRKNKKILKQIFSDDEDIMGILNAQDSEEYVELVSDLKEELGEIELTPGEKGEKGDSPTSEDLIELIRPLVPKDRFHVGLLEPSNPQNGDIWIKI